MIAKECLNSINKPQHNYAKKPIITKIPANYLAYQSLPLKYAGNSNRKILELFLKIQLI